MTRSVEALIEMARALSQSKLEKEFHQQVRHELGELVSFLEAVRQTLQSLSNSVDGSRELIPQLADGVAEINRETESGFNSVWEAVEQMQLDQAAARQILGADAGVLNQEEVARLRGIAAQSQQSLLALMSYLSFQDVLRQRLEKIQRIIGEVEAKTLELIAKFNVHTNKKSPKDGDPAGVGRDADLDQNRVDQLMALLR